MRLVACRYCGEMTRMIHTKMCDSCWNLKRDFECADESTIKKIARELCDHGEDKDFTFVDTISGGEWYICECGAWYDLRQQENHVEVTRVATHDEIVDLIKAERLEAARRVLSETITTIQLLSQRFVGNG